ncbi:hypothetical protein GCM10022416_14570 [Actinomadura keratinilytica]|uniref:Uncharacterized protein n=1 Tax=Actinomadura keratinilytica TaxID=547461 RepID=A0ABP7YBF3_9ACTN
MAAIRPATGSIARAQPASMISVSGRAVMTDQRNDVPWGPFTERFFDIPVRSLDHFGSEKLLVFHASAG